MRRRHAAVGFEVAEFENVIDGQGFVWQRSVWRLEQVRVEQVLWEQTSFPTCLQRRQHSLDRDMVRRRTND